MKTMHTRIGRTLMAAAVAGGLTAFAQEAPQVAPAPPPPAAPGAAGAPLGTNAPAATETKTAALAWADRDFLQKAMELHTTGAELAKLAEKNAGTEEVQALGEELLTEHARSIAALREIARVKNAEANTGPTASQQAMITEFTGKLGNAFDEEYRAQALSNHEQAIRLFAEAAKSKDHEIRTYAERTLGEMKERHAALGGDAVKVKGSIAATLPKPAKSNTPDRATTRNAKGKATPAPAPAASQPASPATAATGVAQATPQAPQATPQAPQTTPPLRRPAPRPMPVSHFVQNLDGTYSIVDPNDPRLANPARPYTENDLIGAQSTIEPATALTPSSTDPRAMWRVPREFAEENDRRLDRRPSTSIVMAAPSPSAPKRSARSTGQDAAIARAPVARVVLSHGTPTRAVARETNDAVSADRPVIIARGASATRTFRIFDGD